MDMAWSLDYDSPALSLSGRFSCKIVNSVYPCELFLVALTRMATLSSPLIPKREYE